MSEQHDDGATPPDGGRMTRDAMRRASELPLESAGGASDTLAASGGLELPGRAGEANSAALRADRADAEHVAPLTAESGRPRRQGSVMAEALPELGPVDRIPGERDPSTAMPSTPGIIAGTGFGEHLPPDANAPLEDDTRREREREGGGDPGHRRRRAEDESQK